MEYLQDTFILEILALIDIIIRNLRFYGLLCNIVQLKSLDVLSRKPNVKYDSQKTTYIYHYLYLLKLECILYLSYIDPN